MKKLIVKTVAEILKVVAAAILAGVGLTASGCCIPFFI